MKFTVPAGHYLVCYDYGMGGLWWFIKADSAEQIRRASSELTVFDHVPEWMSQRDWDHIILDDLQNPRDKALRMILAGQD